VNDYISWLFFDKNLSSDSVHAYIAHIKTVKKLNGEDISIWESFVTKTVVKGTKSKQITEKVPKQTRKVMTLSLLKLLGHEIASSDWSNDSKRVVWAAACTLFFGS